MTDTSVGLQEEPKASKKTDLKHKPLKHINQILQCKAKVHFYHERIYRSVFSYRVVQVQVASDYVELDTEQHHQHAGAIDSNDAPSKTWSVKTSNHL